MSLFTCIIFYTLVLFSHHSGAETNLTDYYSYHEYMEKYAHQKNRVNKFSARVRSPVQSREPKVNEQIKIAVVYPGIQASDYWRRSVSSLEARLREQKIPYEITPYFTKPVREIRLQEKQIEIALKKDPDYLIFTLDALRHAQIIQRLIKKGKPKVIVQNSTRPVRNWGERQPFMYVGFDHAVGSSMLADRFMEEFPKGTEYAMFYGSRGLVSSVRGDTFEHKVDNQHSSKFSVSYFLDFDRERSRKAALHLISRKKMPPFVFACSTDIALGVIDAAKESGILQQVSVNGWGGGGDELEAIINKELNFTVMRMNDDNGVAMAEAIYLDKTGRENEIPQVYSGDIVLIDQNSDSEEIEKLRKQAFRYSDHWQSSPESILTSSGY